MKLSESDDFQMRYYDTTDGPTLKRWMMESRVNQFLSVQSEVEVDGQIQIWDGYSRFKCGLTATVDGKRCGMAMIYLMPYRKVAHHGVGHVIVPPKYQKQGIGTSLARNLLNLGKEYFRLERLQFEVFGASPLLQLLKTEGCSEVFTQKDYVKSHDEFIPRILMEKVY
jgi:RimJ/RimL family protein N-acetyltransferase